jgi:cysteine desulfurase
MTIYLDNAATTPVAPQVIDAMAHAMVEAYANPSSRHALGLAAERRLDSARQRIASPLAVAPDRLVLTSGGTEANALAVLGTARAQRRMRHLLVSAVEHPSVLESARLLEREGFGVERLPVTRGGWVDPGEVGRRLRSDTCLVAVMHVNNETGVRQPVEEIGGLLRGRAAGCRLLVDAVQSFTVLPTTLDALGADLLTLSGHKIHGPKGIGCLALREEVRLAPLWGGGDQEEGRRAGTENLPAAVGLARALELPPPALPPGQLSELLLEEVRRQATAVYALGDAPRRAPHILALAVPGVRAEVLLNLLEERGVVVSSGAACHSRRSLRSHVLDAMAVPREHGVIRVSLSRRTTEDEIRAAARIIGETIRELGG